MMTAEQLKVSLYLLLFSGKLTEQLADDGTAKELLRRIEKKHPAGKNSFRIVKKESGDYYEVVGTKETRISDELLFDIPDNWAWVHLNEIAVSGLGKTLNKSKDTGDTKQYLCSINVYWDGIHIDEIKEAKFSESDIGKYKLMRGDLLICEGGDAGRAAIWEYENEMYYQNALHRVRFWEGIDPYYFRALMEFYKLNGTIDSYCKGMTIKHLVQGSLNAMRFPLPPLAEQKRIVAKIEELMPFVEQYAAASTKLNTLNTTFPDLIKKSILREAVQGKLVPQDPNDEPASVLLKRIAEEKKRLIKEGKIKRQKPLPEITEDEIPFDIPESWEWARWGTIVNVVSARRVHQADWKREGVPFYRAREIAKLAENGHVDNELYISSELYDEYSKSGVPQAGDLMVTAVGTLGKVYIVREDDKFYYKDASVICLENIGNIYPDYLKYLMQSDMMIDQIRSNSSGTTVATLTMVRMVKYLLPIPPLAEQKRIVSKIEELMSSIDALL